jgi:hypothetical protein
MESCRSFGSVISPEHPSIAVVDDSPAGCSKGKVEEQDISHRMLL